MTTATQTKKMSWCTKAEAVRVAKAEMESSKLLCLNDAVYNAQIGNQQRADEWLEKAAQYAWGFNRPQGW